jgi:hypothetical protein
MRTQFVLDFVVTNLSEIAQDMHGISLVKVVIEKNGGNPRLT